MFPLSAIPSSLPVSSLTPGMAPEATPLPATPEIRPGTLEGTQGIAAPQPASDSFANLLGKMVDEVNTRQQAATDAVGQLQSGGNVSLHQTVIAMEEANVSFQLMVEVRNRLLESYQEIMRMQV